MNKIPYQTFFTLPYTYLAAGFREWRSPILLILEYRYLLFMVAKLVSVDSPAIFQSDFHLPRLVKALVRKNFGSSLVTRLRAHSSFADDQQGHHTCQELRRWEARQQPPLSFTLRQQVDDAKQVVVEN